ncbi:MAG TPA: [LysW]-aminoadipate kinase [Candidatus Fraserbacteria bacterium]|nr:[LysW]-aminoadipate kinase [Candidatus Fraserbacteria bacterium]
MFVVKVGGGAGIDYEVFLNDLVRHRDYLLVHGGSHELNMLSTRLGVPPVFVTSVSGFTSRFTDRRTLEIFNMVYAGKQNKLLVEKLQALGVNAIGLSGLDGRLLEGRRKRALKIRRGDKKVVLRGDYSGTIEQVNADLLRLLLNHGYTPVICPPAISHEGVAINVDGDRCAAQIAVALQAETLLLLSNVPGLLRDLDDETSLIREIPRAELDRFMEEVAQGRMKKKLLGAKEALDGNVARVIIGDARGPAPVTGALCSGTGTVIER